MEPLLLLFKLIDPHCDVPHLVRSLLVCLCNIAWCQVVLNFGTVVSQRDHKSNIISENWKNKCPCVLKFIPTSLSPTPERELCILKALLLKILILMNGCSHKLEHKDLQHSIGQIFTETLLWVYLKSLWKMDLGSKFILVKRLDIRASFFFLSFKKKVFICLFSSTWKTEQQR